MTKKIQFFFATLLMALTVSLSAMAEVVYEPLIVDSGFNRDVIAEATTNSSPCTHAVSYLYGAGSTTHTCYYSMATTSVINTVNVGKMNEEDYALASQTGWPDDPTHDDANRIIRCIEDAKNDPRFVNVFWQLAPYDGPNALCLRPDTDSEDVEEGLSNQGKGYLKFKKVGCYQKLYFLIVSPKLSCKNADSNPRGVWATVHYTDGTSTDPQYFASIGLSGNPNTKVCKTNIYEGKYKKNTKSEDTNTAYACAYEFDHIDPTKLIKSIEFENKKNCTGSIILGITGMTADVETPNDEAATVSNISQNSFEACWDAIANAASYRLDVAEDPDFQHILEDYNNLAVSGSTCQQVAGLIADNDYYWRVRAVDGEGGQSASSAPKRVKTEAEDGPKTESEESLTIEEDMTALLNTTTNLIVNRTLWKDGYYNTLCLPFSMTAEEIAASPIAGGQIYEFDYATVLGEAQLDIHVKDTDAIQAGMPYLIQWPNMGVTINNLLFEGVTITTDRGLTVGDEHEVQFVGNVALAAMENGNKNLLFLGANNTLYWPNTDKGMKGFRAHFEIPTSGAAAVKKGTPARIVTDTHVATDLDRTQQEKEQCTKILRDGHIYILREGVQYNVLGIKQ